MVSPIVLSFNDGTQVVCQAYPDNDDGHAASSKTYDLLGRAHWQAGRRGHGFSGSASRRKQGAGATNAQGTPGRLFATS
jgi:hypothetical protein